MSSARVRALETQLFTSTCCLRTPGLNSYVTRTLAHLGFVALLQTMTLNDRLGPYLNKDAIGGSSGAQTKGEVERT